MSGDIEGKKALVWNYIEGLHERRDFSILEETLASPDVGLRSDVDSFEEATAVHREALSKWEDVRCERDRVIAEGNDVVIKWRMAAKLVEEFRGIAPTGHEMEVEIITMARVEDDGIVSLFDEYDRRQWIPTVTRLARSGILENMNDGILIVDADGVIVDANSQAAEILDVPENELLDATASTVFGASLPDVGRRTDISLSDSQRVVQLETSPVTEPEGERLGRTLLFRDVTDQRRQSEQLQVLNRVLRHNLRNALTTIAGQIEYLSEAEDPPAERIERAVEVVLGTVEELTDLSEKVQRAETVFSSRSVEPKRQNLTNVLASVVARMETEFPTVDVTVDVPDDVIVTAVRPLEVALEAVVENACEHNDAQDPEVTVRVDPLDESCVRVTVADNGPGIPEHERHVFESGEETPLEHSSGLDLWLVYWVVTLSDGDLSFSENDPRGTIVKIDLPTVDGADVDESGTSGTVAE